MVFRDKRGVEYDAVPLPTHEVTVAVALDARIVRRTAARKTVPVYAGTDGAELAEQPRGHRRHWTDRQWLAFEEHRRLEAELSRDDEPIATVWVVKPHDPASTDPPDPRREGHPPRFPVVPQPDDDDVVVMDPIPQRVRTGRPTDRRTRISTMTG